jgi:glycerol-3-phosphate acyltransferase PlsY
MRGLLRFAVAGFAGYLLGLVPSADIAASLAGRRGDVRTQGSGNPGATNAAKVLGRRWGAAVLGVDVAKGAGAAWFGRRCGPGAAAVGGLGAVLGHTYPVGRSGGKGVATRYGAIGIAAPGVAAVDLVVAATVAQVTKRPDRAMAAGVAAGLASAPWTGRSRGGPIGVLLAGVSGAIVLWRFVGAARVRRAEGEPGLG